MELGLEEFAAKVADPSPTRGSKTSLEVLPYPGNERLNKDEPWKDIIVNPSCWAENGNVCFPVSKITDKLKNGVYRCGNSENGPYLEKMNIQCDNLLNLSDSATELILAEFEKFWMLKKNFQKRGFLFKRGFLLWGPPGSGKTSAVWQLTQSLINYHNGIVLWIDNAHIAALGASIIRKIEPNRPIVTIMEDIETLIQRNGEHELLSFLDGETQIQNIVHVATTNYPEMLDKRFVDRPSRFDTIMKVDMPSAKAREEYFVAKEPGLDEATLKRWIDKSDGYSIAHLREIIIAVKCFDQAENEVFKRLDLMKERKPSSADLYSSKVGFGR